MSNARRWLIAVLTGATLLTLAGGASALPPGVGIYRGFWPYGPRIAIGGWPYYGWPPLPPWAMPIYDLRGLDPPPVGITAYRAPYGSGWAWGSGGAYRPRVETPAVPTVEQPATEPEVVPPPPPEPMLNLPPSGPREF